MSLVFSGRVVGSVEGAKDLEEVFVYDVDGGPILKQPPRQVVIDLYCRDGR